MAPVDLCPGILTLGSASPSALLGDDSGRGLGCRCWTCGVLPLQVPHIHPRVFATVPQESSGVLATIWPAQRSAQVTGNVT